MFGYFYNSSIRRYVTLMGSLFSDIHVKRERDGEIHLIRVPITWASKEAFVRKLNSRLNDDDVGHAKIETILPRLSLEIVDIAYKSMANTSRINKAVKRGENPGDTIGRYNPTPYTITYQLSAYTRYEDDMFQILEQILPYFKPSFTCRIDEVYDKESNKQNRNIPITLTSIVPVEDWDGGQDSRRRVEWSMTFTMEGWIYPPQVDIHGEIRTVYVDFSENQRVLDTSGEAFDDIESVDSESCDPLESKVTTSYSSGTPIPTGEEESGIRGEGRGCEVPGEEND